MRPDRSGYCINEVKIMHKGLQIVLGFVGIGIGFLGGVNFANHKWSRQYPALRRIEMDNFMALVTLKSLRAGKLEYAIGIQENELDMQALFFADVARMGQKNSEAAKTHLKYISEYRSGISYTPPVEYQMICGK
jgi:hypothetical protein